MKDSKDKKNTPSKFITSFTLSDKQIAKLLDESALLEAEEAKAGGRLGYMSRMLIQATLPHSDPKTNEFIRTNGNYKLTMLAPSSVGLPYGSIPRIILAWITTEAVKTKNIHIYLGENLASFLKKLGFDRTGGVRGDITRVREQLRKLLQTNMIFEYEDEGIEMIKNIQTISDLVLQKSLWVTPSNEMSKWETSLTLNSNFFEHIINNPVPIDLGAVQALKNSSLAIDIYCWLTYRMFALKRETLVPWERLFIQFGTGYANDAKGKYAFKRKFVEQLKKVAILYPHANFDVEEPGLILKKSLPHIKPKPKKENLIS